jgi:c-di-GMP-binding flagellar brake protein YcgR
MSATTQSCVESSFTGSERRKFPRIVASCPVRYLQTNDNDWSKAELCDYSATGVRMVSESTVLQSSKIDLVLMPEAKSRVPGIAAEATVLRCGLRDDHRYEIACKFTKVKRQRKNVG